MTDTAADTSGHATAKVIIGAVRETAPGERRVALTPETCKKLVAAGALVRIERGLGDGAHALDAAYADVGAEIVDGADAVLASADIVVCVQPPSAQAIAGMKQGAVLVGMLQPQGDAAQHGALLHAGDGLGRRRLHADDDIGGRQHRIGDRKSVV